MNRSRNDGGIESYDAERQIASHSTRIQSVDSNKSDGEDRAKKKPPPLPARPPPDSPPDLKNARRSQRGSSRREAKGAAADKNGSKQTSSQEARGLFSEISYSLPSA